MSAQLADMILGKDKGLHLISDEANSGLTRYERRDESQQSIVKECGAQRNGYSRNLD